MSQAYFLIPGLLLPHEAQSVITPSSLAAASTLTAAVKGDFTRQTLVSGPLACSVHLAWTWRVLTRRPLPFSSAPFAWLIDDGPDLTSEIWSLHVFHREPDGRVVAADLSEETVEAVCQTLRRPLSERGFTLQRWDKIFYLTRQTGWGVMTPEWPVIRAARAQADDVAPLPEADEVIAQEARTDLHDLTNLLRRADIRDVQGRQLTELAITGGGCQQRFNPPTKIRSVLADDATIRSWAQESGILNHRTGRVDHAEQWPEDAPAGDLIAVLDFLYEPWLKNDWTEWMNRLPAVVSSFQALAPAARRKQCDTAVLVACGVTDTVTVATATSTGGLLARLRQKAVPASQWIFE